MVETELVDLPSPARLLLTMESLILNMGFTISIPLRSVSLACAALFVAHADE